MDSLTVNRRFFKIVAAEKKRERRRAMVFAVGLTLAGVGALCLLAAVGYAIDYIVRGIV